VKICYLADGKSVHTQKWVRFFANRRCEVHLISFQNADIPNVIFHPIKLSFPVRISPAAPSYTKIGYLFYLDKIKRLIHRIAPDIVHAHWATSYGLIGAYASYHPFILSTWGSDVLDFPHRSLVHRLILGHIINRADYLTATSRMLAEETRKHLRKKKIVHTIPFGVDIARFSPKAPKVQQDFTVGIVKKLERKYGIDYLIKAFAKLFRVNSKAKLLIVGDGSEELTLKKLCKSLDVDRNVSFIGFVENERVPDYLSQMDIFVVPSIMSSETFGVAAVEAAACKLPVIASNIGGLPEVVIDGETGFLVPSKDPNAIAEKMVLLMQEIELRKRMGEAARRFVEQNYVWEENAKEMERLYLRAAKKRG
jgi:glycosyltransferase involved in cell wall biosynthesis